MRQVRWVYDVLWRRREVTSALYVAVGVATSLTLSALTVAAYWLVTVPGLGLTPPIGSKGIPHPLELLFGTVLFAPLVETAILAVILWLAGWFIRRNGWRALVGAIPLGAIHGMEGRNPFDVGGHIAVATVAFLVFAVVYLSWRRVSLQHAFWTCALVHMIHNSIFVVVLLVYANLVVRTSTTGGS